MTRPRVVGGSFVPRAGGTAVLCALLAMGAGLPLHSQDGADVESRIQTIRASLEAGRYTEAETAAEALLAQVDRGTSGASPDRTRATNLLVTALLRNGKGAQPRTRRLAEWASQSSGAQADPALTDLARTDPELAADGLRNLGEVLIDAGEYAAAIVPCRRALAIDERVRARAPAALADDLDCLARAFTLVERYDEALETSDRAVAILDGEPRVRTLALHGFVLQRRGEHDRARRVLEGAVALAEATHGLHPDTARTLKLLGDELWLEGDLVESHRVLASALAIAERTLRADHPDLAACLRSLAVPASDLGDLAGARALRQRGLAIAERALGADHPDVAMQLNDLAISAFSDGDYAAARPLYERARHIYQTRLGPTHSGVTTAIHNLAIVSARLGDYAEARRQFNRAIATWERVVGREHPYVARPLTALAEMLAEQGLHAEAKRVYERALAIREQGRGKSPLDVARTLAGLSGTLASLGETDRAQILATRAVTIWQEAGAAETRGGASALVNLARLQLDRDAGAARGTLERALAIRRRILGPAHPDVAEVQTHLVVLLASLPGESAAAFQAALDAEEVSRQHLRLTLRYLPERQALAHAARAPAARDIAISLGGDDARVAGVLFDRIIRARAVTLDEMAARHHVTSDTSRPDVAPFWQALSAARRRYANLVVRGPSEQRLTQGLRLIEDAKREKERAERALAEKSAPFRTEQVRTGIGLEAVRAGLPPDSALVSFVRYDRTAAPARVREHVPPASRAAAGGRRSVPSYVAFVVTPGASAPVTVPLGPATAIDVLVARWRRETVTGAGRGTGPGSADALRTIGTRLRRRIWDPVGTVVGGVRRVFVVPDGSLNLVPLAALPIGTSSYLLERGPAIHYLSAERDLVPSPAGPAATQGLLALGGPSFDDHSGGRAGRGRSPASPAATLRGSAQACSGLQAVRFQPLVGTLQEVRELARLWETGAERVTAGASVRVLIGRHATEGLFTREAHRYRVLHLATHGFFLGASCSPPAAGTRGVGGLATVGPPRPAENPLLLSGLALAGANRRASASVDEDDGILTAEEVASLDLAGVEWAVLSACDTGVGEVKAGEGVFGLRRAFQIAGARTVIMSLWSVDDQAARAWMRALYEGRLRTRLSTADAVHAASLAVLRARRSRGLSTHPFYWAGFVAAGDWR